MTNGSLNRSISKYRTNSPKIKSGQQILGRIATKEALCWLIAVSAMPIGLASGAANLGFEDIMNYFQDTGVAGGSQCCNHSWAD